MGSDVSFRVFVGTMYSGENEFHQSQLSLDAQKHMLIERFIVRDLPEAEAARQLYTTWNSVKEFYDFFVQLDPDVVLAHEEVLYDACLLLSRQMAAGSSFTSLQAPLHDFLSDAEVMGLNVYSPLVVFKETSNELYTDRCTVNNVTLQPGHCASFSQSLIPAGEHSPDPRLEQAFHYGIHRGLKGQHARKQAIVDAFIRCPDARRAMAIAGFNYSHLFKDGGFNYNDDTFKAVFEETKKRIK